MGENTWQPYGTIGGLQMAAGSHLLQINPAITVQYYNFANAAGTQGYSRPLAAMLNNVGFQRFQPDTILNFAGAQTTTAIGNVGRAEVVNILQAQGFATQTEVAIANGSRVIDVAGFRPGWLGGNLIYAESKVGYVAASEFVVNQIGNTLGSLAENTTARGVGVLGLAGGTGLLVGTSLYTQWAAYSADGYTFGPQSQDAAAANGFSLGGSIIGGGAAYLLGASVATGGGLGGVLGIGIYSNYQMYQDLAAKDPQLAAALLYGQAGNAAAAAGVYDFSSPYYVLPNPVWQPPAFVSPAWPGDPPPPTFWQATGQALSTGAATLWNTIQATGSYISDSIITPANGEPAFSMPATFDNQLLFNPTPFASSVFGPFGTDNGFSTAPLSEPLYNTGLFIEPGNPPQGDGLQTFGSNTAPFWVSTVADWYTPPVTDVGASAPDSGVVSGSTQGVGGNDSGTTGTTVIDAAPTTDPVFSPPPDPALSPPPIFSPTPPPDPAPVTVTVTPSNSGATVSVGSSGIDWGDIFSVILDVFSSFFSWPVVLDLTGNGIKITPLSSSNTYFDMAGDGYQHRTAWAGAGNGVLVLDLVGDGQITQRNQVVFTDWDPTATTDLQALADVFDTNHDGRLDAGDAQFSSFKILVTNQDGTTTLKTLAEAGVQSINLIPDATTIALPDGSKIQGQTTFTKSDGTTGTAATVQLQYIGDGNVIRQTVDHNPDGSTSITNSALNPDGSVASALVGTTSADGQSRTLFFDHNGDGVIDQIQTAVTITNPDGSTNETLSNQTGAGVLVDLTITMTSADRTLVTI